MSNGEQFFNANKQDRNAAFSFPNGYGNQDPPEENGDQSARVHPFPRVIPASEQKVGNAGVGDAGYEAAAEEAAGSYGG